KPFIEIAVALKPLLKRAEEALPELLALREKYSERLEAVLSIDQLSLRAYPTVSDRTVTLLKRAAQDAHSLIHGSISTLQSAPFKAREIEQGARNESSPISAMALVHGLEFAIEAAKEAVAAIEGQVGLLDRYAEALKHQLDQAGDAPTKLIRVMRPE